MCVCVIQSVHRVYGMDSLQVEVLTVLVIVPHSHCLVDAGVGHFKPESYYVYFDGDADVVISSF